MSQCSRLLILSDASLTAWPWTWRHYHPPKRREQLPNEQEPPQNPRRQKGHMKQGPCRELTNIRRHRAKFSRPRFVHSCLGRLHYPPAGCSTSNNKNNSNLLWTSDTALRYRNINLTSGAADQNTRGKNKRWSVSNRRGSRTGNGISCE